jgi:hypothetical protein
MACKQGIRQSMEASRAYHQQQKVYDPARELWRALVERSAAEPDLRSWSTQERRYFAVVLLEGEVYNGGFDQYFTNSSADHYQDAVVCLEELGAIQSLKLLQEAAAVLFDEQAPPTTQAGRTTLMKEKFRWPEEDQPMPEWATRLEVLDDQFYKDPDRLGDLLDAYAETHDLVTPFKKQI